MKRTALAVAVGLTLVGAGVVGGTSVASASAPRPPSIKDITPEHGPTGGGTTVEIFGKNLGGASAVSFGGSAATVVTPVSPSEVVAVSPAGSGTVDVTVTTSVGTTATTPADQFTYVTTPAIQRLTPGGGTTLGGTRVTISGTGFTGASSVDFGSVPATSYTVESDQEIVAVSPAEGVGVVQVTVTSPTGQTPVDPAATFDYSLKIPEITSVAPDVGPASGGTTVVITGKRFTNVAAVDFGGTPATSYTVTDQKSITAVAPPGTGTVDVSVTNASGQSVVGSPIDQYTYTPGS